MFEIIVKVIYSNSSFIGRFDKCCDAVEFVENAKTRSDYISNETFVFKDDTVIIHEVL